MSIGSLGQFAKVAIGAPDLSKLTSSTIGSAGILTNPGITLFGGPLSAATATAAVSIGPPMAFPGVSLPLSLLVDGISRFNGVVNIYGNINQYSLETSFGGKIAQSLGIKNGVDIKNAMNQGNAITVVNGSLIVNGVITCAWLTKQLSIANSLPSVKPFDIPHPSKKNHRLRHVCLEGPEIGIYVRGKLIDSRVIELPEYWKNFVNYESITVNLTPIGSSASLYVKDIIDNKVIVGGDKHINCYYTVFAERTDYEPLIVEYEGDSKLDYPGQDYLGLKNNSEV